ncbi:MAG: GGDEF domain-containing protein [Clostridiales bacterium]|nr:GGDEF domain-containing protein [Clostridiales bacterium]
MYYSSVGIIALIVHIIINFEALKRVKKTPENMVRYKFRLYLLAIIGFYISDIIWGFFDERKMIIPEYIDTCAFFLTMALSVLLWTRAVVEFSGTKGKLGKMLVGSGWVIFLFEIIVIITNIFKPIVFTFDEYDTYVPLSARYVTLFMQMFLFLGTAIFAFVMSFRLHGKQRTSFIIVGVSAIIMTLFIELQTGFPFMPFYSLGCLFGTCMIHAFVYRTKDVEHNLEIEAINQKAYKDGLTGVKNKLAYIEALTDIETGVENGSLTEYGVVVFDLNGLKAINDNYGHEAGDEYIKSACRLICLQFRHSPVFRIGGDEFVAILKGEDYQNRDYLEGSFREIIDNNQRVGSVVVSSGLAIYTAGTDKGYNDVFNRADELMYARKKALKAMPRQ